MKTIRSKDKTEFASLMDGFFYTHEDPRPLENGVNTIDDMEEFCMDDVDWSKYEIVSVQYIDKESVGADIRNKLSPLLNLISLLERQKEVDDTMKKKLQVYIDREMENGKKSIEYIKNLL
jgi:hypothetical protein